MTVLTVPRTDRTPRTPGQGRVRTGRDRVHAWRHRLSLLAAVMVLSVVGLSVTATVTASTANAYTPTSNGCGAESGLSHALVPNAPLGFDFTAACDSHDLCYGSGDSKAFCDNQFADNMDAVCDGNVICDGIAWLYAKAVQWFGQSSWDQATQERLDDLMNKLDQCGDDAACDHAVTQQADIDSFEQGIAACNGDSACEDAVWADFSDASGVSDDPSTDPSQADPSDPGDPGDPGDGDTAGDGSGDGGDGGGGSDVGGGGGGGGSGCDSDYCQSDGSRDD